MKVSACLVTRGDVDLWPIHESLSEAVIQGVIHEVIVYNNRTDFHGDKQVYGRYIAAHKAEGDLIYTQDDDCVLPLESIAELIATWDEMRALADIEQTPDPGNFIVANMPAEFRHDFYDDHCLIGFGAVFPRGLPQLAFNRVLSRYHHTGEFIAAAFERTCDVAFTALTHRVLANVPYENLPWATSKDRMYRRKEHVAERQRMLELALTVREQRTLVG